MAEGAPETTRVAKEDERKEDRKGAPGDQLRGQGQARIIIEQQKAADHEDRGDSVVDVDRADEVTGLAFEYQMASRALRIHRKRPAKQSAGATARTRQPH